MQRDIRSVESYANIVAGAFFMAAAVNFVYEPMQMVVGGFSGIAIAVQQICLLWGMQTIPVWLFTTVLNLPLLIWAKIVKGDAFLFRTVVGTACFSAFLAFMPVRLLFERDYLLATVVGGVMTGFGIGLVFLGFGSTGGTDLLGTLLHKHLRFISASRLMGIADALVVAFGCLVFGVNVTLYAIFAVFITSKMSDTVVEGFDYAKTVFVITERQDEIAATVLREMERGLTLLHAKGMYTGQEKGMIFCAVTKRELPDLLSIVHMVDEQAFVVVQDARRVMGNGFMEIH